MGTRGQSKPATKKPTVPEIVGPEVPGKIVRPDLVDPLIQGGIVPDRMTLAKVIKSVRGDKGATSRVNPAGAIPDSSGSTGEGLRRNIALLPEKDAHLTKEATESIERFVEEVMHGAVEMAVKFANVALLSGIASSAIVPMIGQDEDASKWLALHGGDQLAQWVRNYQTDIDPQNPDAVLTVATQLDKHIKGSLKPVDGGVRLEGASSKMGEEVIQLLQSLNVSQIFERAFEESPKQRKIGVLRLFQKELSKLNNNKQPLQNYYIYNHTLQEIATQSFFMSVGAAGQNSLIRRELRKLRSELKILRGQHMKIVKINTNGGAFILGDVHIKDGNFIGRDGQIISSIQAASVC